MTRSRYDQDTTEIRSGYDSDSTGIQLEYDRDKTGIRPAFDRGTTNVQTYVFLIHHSMPSSVFLVTICMSSLRLVGDILVCTGFLSYSGPFNQAFREMLMSKWQKEMKSRKIPFSSDLNVTGMLVDSTTVGEWNLQVR